MLSDRVLELARGANFAIISTHLPSGRIQSHPMWVDTDGEHLLLNTEIHRRKYKNVLENPDLTVTIMEKGNPWSWVEVRGHYAGSIRGQEARDHIDALAKKYLGVDDYPNPIQTERVIIKVAPEHEFAFPPA